MDLDKQLHSLIKLVSNVSDAYTASLFLVSPSGNELTLQNSHSLSKHLKRDVKIELGSSLIGWVAQHGKAVNASPFKHDPKTLQLYTKEENIKSFLAVPIKIGKETKGVLCVDSKKGFFFTKKMEKIIDEFAKHFSQVIQQHTELQVIREQANGYQHLYNLYKELNGFHNENIYDLLISISRQLFNFDCCLLSTLDDDKRNLTVRMIEGKTAPRTLQKKFPAQEGIASLILRTRKPLLLTDLKSRSTPFFIFTQEDPIEDVACFIGVPLLVNDQAVGFLSFTSKNPHGFGEQDFQLASVISFQASSAISVSRANEQIRHLDSVDSLTGLVTHSLLHTHLEQAFLDPEKHAPFSLLLMDMDGFHKLNLKYGYQIGDELLKKVANILTRLVRDNDIVARFGGEEFCILLKNSPSSRANSVANRIREVIQQTVFVIHGLEIKVTASIGIAGYLEPAISKEDLLHCAKAALAKAKSKRNTVCDYSSLVTS